MGTFAVFVALFHMQGILLKPYLFAGIWILQIIWEKRQICRRPAYSQVYEWKAEGSEGYDLSGFDTDRNFVEASASQQVQQVLHYIIARANTKALWLRLQWSRYSNYSCARLIIFHPRRKTLSPTSLKLPSCLVRERRAVEWNCKPWTFTHFVSGDWHRILAPFRLGILAQPDNSSFTALASSFVRPDKHVHHFTIWDRSCVDPTWGTWRECFRSM